MKILSKKADFVKRKVTGKYFNVTDNASLRCRQQVKDLLMEWGNMNAWNGIIINMWCEWMVEHWWLSEWHTSVRTNNKHWAAWHGMRVPSRNEFVSFCFFNYPKRNGLFFELFHPKRNNLVSIRILPYLSLWGIKDNQTFHLVIRQQSEDLKHLIPSTRSPRIQG